MAAYRLSTFWGNSHQDYSLCNVAARTQIPSLTGARTEARVKKLQEGYKEYPYTLCVGSPIMNIVLHSFALSFVLFLSIYGWPLNNMGLTGMGSLICTFFSINMYNMIRGCLNLRMWNRRWRGPSVKLDSDFWLHGGQRPPPPCCSRVNCVYISFFKTIWEEVVHLPLKTSVDPS